MPGPHLRFGVVGEFGSTSEAAKVGDGGAGAHVLSEMHPGAFRLDVLSLPRSRRDSVIGVGGDFPEFT